MSNDGNMVQRADEPSEIDPDEDQVDEEQQVEEAEEQNEEEDNSMNQRKLDDITMGNLDINNLFVFIRDLIKANYSSDYIEEIKQKHGMGVIPWDPEIPISSGGNAIINVEAIDFNLQDNRTSSTRQQPQNQVTFSVKLYGDDMKRVDSNEVDF